MQEPPPHITKSSAVELSMELAPAYLINYMLRISYPSSFRFQKRQNMPSPKINVTPPNNLERAWAVAARWEQPSDLCRKRSKTNSHNPVHCRTSVAQTLGIRFTCMFHCPPILKFDCVVGLKILTKRLTLRRASVKTPAALIINGYFPRRNRYSFVGNDLDT
jgi:hypothetical protein